MIGFVINPVSGNGRGEKVWRKLEALLKQRNTPFQVRVTTYSGEARQLTMELARREEVNLIVAVGGDGTVNEVVNGIYDADVSCLFGLVATGSGNDFARAHGLSVDPEKALEQLLSGKNRRKIDLLRMDDRVAVNAVGAGFDGLVSKMANESAFKQICNRFRLGVIAYTAAVLRALFTYQPNEVTIQVDGEKYLLSKVWLIAVSNIPNYGGGMRICPQALPDDGWADVCVISDVSRWKLLRAFPLIYSGKHVKHPGVRIFRGKNVMITSEKPLIVHTDGEVVAEIPIQVEILPHRLEIVAKR